MNRRQSRLACERLVEQLDLPDPFDLDDLCARVGRQLGRPVILLATPLALGNLCGVWMATHEADYVFYEQDTTRLHQQHIVCHELGHILRQHSPSKVLGGDIARALAPQLEPGDIQRVLGRDTYDDDAEYEAELIATLILRRAARRRDAGAQATSPEADAIIERISRSLSGGRS